MAQTARLSSAPGAPFDAQALVRAQRTFFETRATLPLAWRQEQLRKLLAAAQKHEAEILAALKSDLGRAIEEGYVIEVGSIYAEVKRAIRDVKKWMRPTRAPAPITIHPARCFRYAEPLGTTLIISPWNYPYHLTISPLIGALAAGCTAVVKPSELSPATSAVISKMLGEAFPREVVAVVEGDAEVSKALLAQKWDLIFFTGSTQVGRIVAEAAAKHLTPTVLELGGKSPVIIDKSADLATSARRVAWGKFINCGQTCIAPDYVLIAPELKVRFAELLKEAVTSFYGADVKQSPDYGRIVSERHFKRLSALMGDGKVAFGGERDAGSRFFAPTVVTDVSPDSPLMQEEIFGPLLPLVDCQGPEDAIRFVRARPKPLALYTFGNSAANERILQETSSGGAVANDCVIHFAAEDLPFGGVGDSGLGGYHGPASFDVFSHKKSVVKRPLFIDVKLRYPPYKGKLGLFRRLLG